MGLGIANNNMGSRQAVTPKTITSLSSEYKSRVGHEDPMARPKIYGIWKFLILLKRSFNPDQSAGRPQSGRPRRNRRNRCKYQYRFYTLDPPRLWHFRDIPEDRHHT